MRYDRVAGALYVPLFLLLDVALVLVFYVLLNRRTRPSRCSRRSFGS